MFIICHETLGGDETEEKRQIKSNNLFGYVYALLSSDRLFRFIVEPCSNNTPIAHIIPTPHAPTLYTSIPSELRFMYAHWIILPLERANHKTVMRIRTCVCYWWSNLMVFAAAAEPLSVCPFTIRTRNHPQVTRLAFALWCRSRTSIESQSQDSPIPFYLVQRVSSGLYYAMCCVLHCLPVYYAVWGSTTRRRGDLFQSGAFVQAFAPTLRTTFGVHIYTYCICIYSLSTK